MKICLLGDFSGTPDEGMKNISRTTYDILSLNHDVMKINSRDIVKAKVIKNLRRFKPQIVHYLHGPTIRSLVMLKALKFILGKDVKIVVSATRPYFSRFSRWSIPLLKPDLILTQSEKFENFFLNYGCRVEFSPNGVDSLKFYPASSEDKTALRRKHNLPLDKEIILHVGHIKQNRKLELFIALQGLENKQVVVVGGTVEKSDEELKERLLESGVIVIHKYLENIAEIYQAADLYLFPISDSQKDLPESYNQIGAIDLPLSVLEAMACNLPVLSTPFGALPRLFKEGEGLEYAEASEFLDKTKCPITLGNIKTRDKVLPYDWRKILDQHVNLYCQLIENNNEQLATGDTVPKKKEIHNFKLINIIGVDGAGKTTLATSIAEELHRKDKKISYRYCQYFAKLLYPVKLFAKLSVMRKTDEFKDYNTYNTTKKATSSRYPLLAKLYAIIWLIDYLLQVLVKVSLPILLGRRLIIDRYIFDIAVNLSLTTNQKVNFAKKLIDLFFKFCSRPDLVIFIDLPEEVAMARKDDIQDIEYLRERRERYLWLAEQYGFTILDGTRTPQQLVDNTKELLCAFCENNPQNESQAARQLSF